MSTTMYVNSCDGRYSTALKRDGKKVTELLWGDAVRVEKKRGKLAAVEARGEEGEVDAGCLGQESLLEFYLIDVGQGDGCLVRTPDDRWHVVDAGVPNARQMTRKGAPNFIRWKFLTDLGKRSIDLHSVIMSHPDEDHYGGLIDLLSGALEGHKPFKVAIKNFYHGGMGRFDSDDAPLGSVKPGIVADPPDLDPRFESRGDFIVDLLGGKASFKNPPLPFTKQFGRLAEQVLEKCDNIQRLSLEDKFMPDYGPRNRSGVTVRVLGPVIERLKGGGHGLRFFPKDRSGSKTRNGHSIVLRFDYGDARILLTGDLNKPSQRLLLGYVPAQEYTVDVAKGCHHGSEDVDFDFIKAMAARGTVISSGDSEDYAHPRPIVVGASGRYGRDTHDLISNEPIPPLVYSTEISRSVKLAYMRHLVTQDVAKLKLDGVSCVTGAKGADKKLLQYQLARLPVAVDLVYGLVNVRTDGKCILFATMKEKGKGDFDIKVIRAG